MSDISVLCVDDEKYIGDIIRDYISPAYRCFAYQSPAEALAFLRTTDIDILVVDFRMPGMNGLDFLKEARKLDSYHAGLLLTAYADKDLLRDVLNDHLVDRALEKPLNLEILKAELDIAAGKIRTGRERSQRMKDLYRVLSSCGEAEFAFIGRDGDLSELWKQVRTVAPTDENVLITGETGTGKDVLARQIHALSARAGKPFIKINCGAIPSTLIESELFGYEKGAFSGADRRKYGKIELANGGTLFLDEIGELPAELQSRLLHVVEDKAIERVGGTERIGVDFRLISATNKELDKPERIEFRRDLYFRISTVHLRLPDLKDRKSDLPLHILSLIRRNCRLFQRPVMEISPAAMDLLCGHSWPGNIRELDNVLKRVILMKGDGNTPLVPADFSLFLVGGTGTDGSFSVVVDRLAREMISGKKPIQSVERALLEKVIELCGGKVMDAARKTGTPKDRFYRLQDAQER